MRLHLDEEAFESLIIQTSGKIGIPESAVRRDYFIVLLLGKLAESEFAEVCVFKGGTSLSKCYPGSIERFSEDIDLTFVPDEELTEKEYSRTLKQIESIMIDGSPSEKINGERNNRNKSTYVWFAERRSDEERIKLEIGSSVKPDPYSKKKIRSYIHEVLQNEGREDLIDEFQLLEVELNVLGIERTFIDKLFAVKRHAICGTLNSKVRHVYDVSKLFEMDEVKAFLEEKEQLKRIVQHTKETDSCYLLKRSISEKYNPAEPYGFPSWQDRFDEIVRKRYGTLHEDLLYTDERQDFNEAYQAFAKISDILEEIGE